MLITSNKQQQPRDTKNSTVRSTQMSFYIQLERSNKKAKELLHRTFTRQLSNTKTKIYKPERFSHRKTDRTYQHESENLNKTNHCLNILRDQIHEEQSKEILLKNRINYYDNEKQRCIKTVQQAKRKYSTIMQNRTEALKIKKSLNKNRTFIQKEHRNYINTLRQKATIEKDEKNKTLQSWKNRKLSEASLIKDQKRSIHKRISNEKSIDYQKKCQTVKSVKAREEVLHKNTIKTIQSKKKIAKQNHSLKVFQELEKKKYIIKKNKQLMKKMTDKQNQIKNIAEKANKEIQVYQDLFKFKLFKKRNIPIPNTARSQQNSKLFLTKV